MAELYAQAAEADKLENWEAAIKVLDELTKTTSNYRDSIELLRNAKRQKQPKELYTEARALHGAGKWQAVLRVFEQILAIDSTFQETCSSKNCSACERGVPDVDEIRCRYVISSASEKS